jgi:hypothetical protein
MMMNMTTDEALAVLDAAAVYVNSEIIPMKKARAHFATLTERLRVAEESRDAYKRDAESLLAISKGAADALESAEAELAACKEDAARYRWLRDEAAIIEEPAPLVFHADADALPGLPIHGRMLDAAIDAARLAPGDGVKS